MMYIFFFLLGIAGVMVGYGIGRKAGYALGWKAAWFIFAAEIQKIKQELYEEGKKHDASKGS